ncbi:MAG: hypothetical protein WDN26_10345 [Chitinophagaceae bacterium]
MLRNIAVDTLLTLSWKEASINTYKQDAVDTVLFSDITTLSGIKYNTS